MKIRKIKLGLIVLVAWVSHTGLEGTAARAGTFVSSAGPQGPACRITPELNAAGFRELYIQENRIQSARGLGFGGSPVKSLQILVDRCADLKEQGICSECRIEKRANRNRPAGPQNAACRITPGLNASGYRELYVGVLRTASARGMGFGGSSAESFDLLLSLCNRLTELEVCSHCRIEDPVGKRSGW